MPIAVPTSRPSLASSQIVSRACFFQSSYPSTVSASCVAALVAATQRSSSPSWISLISATPGRVGFVAPVREG
jgi:hypothetical protein